MPLTDEEKAELSRLQQKEQEPEPRGGGRSENIDVYIDMSDEAAVQRAIDHGYLTRAEADELDEDGDGKPKRKRKAAEEDDDSPAPRRAGYFANE